MEPHTTMKELIPDDNPSVLAVIVAGAITGTGFVLMWVWNHTMGRIRTLEKNKVERSEFNGYVTRADESRREVRESIGRLFDKVDEVKDMIREQGK